MQPLTGIRVLDLSRVLAGPYCTMVLGDLGADVIKVESPEGDETRGWGPPFLEGGSAYYMCVNRNKRSIIADFRTEEGHRIISKLISGGAANVSSHATSRGWRVDTGWLAVEIQ
jgi:crotonobetainyl-CoA:carnitine CoA-transferase CaiB-like acyl-CoA transferase